MQESTLTARGQTTLPAQVRAALGLKPGDKLRYVVLDTGEVRLLKARPVMGLAGMLRHDGAPVTLDEMDEAIGKGAAGE